MDKLAQGIYDNWVKNLSPTQYQQWTNLVEDTKKNQKEVDSSIEKLETYLQQNPTSLNLHKSLIKISRRLLSSQFDTLTACIKKEVKFLPESIRKAHSVIRSGWSKTAIRVIAEADEYLEILKKN